MTTRCREADARLYMEGRTDGASLFVCRRSRRRGTYPRRLAGRWRMRRVVRGRGRQRPVNRRQGDDGRDGLCGDAAGNVPTCCAPPSGQSHQGTNPVTTDINFHLPPGKVAYLGEQSIFRSFVLIFKTSVYINKSSVYSFKSFVFTLLAEGRNFSRRVMEVYVCRHRFSPLGRGLDKPYFWRGDAPLMENSCTLDVKKSNDHG